MTALRLRPLRLEDEAAVHVAHRELAAEGFDFALGLDGSDDWPGHVARCGLDRRGIDLPPGRVPATFLVAVVDGEIVGRTSIRHDLNAFLRAEGGHIGYAVRPGFRKRGYATEILTQSLVVARAVGVDRALLTCDEHNAASATVIERCGGVLDPDRPRTDPPRPKLRYWIA